MSSGNDRIRLREQVSRVRDETGARVIALGEEHNYIGNIKAIRADISGLQADGYKSLYLEIGTNQQDLIDKALGGDKNSQRDLRLKFERWFGFYGGTEAAQQRYDMLFDARRAGMRVLAVDMDDRRDHMQRYNSLVENEEHQILSARLGIGDAMISANIKRLDDGNPGLLLIGKAHTYNAAPGGHIENLGVHDGDVGYYQSQHGGTSQRLNALGIKTASIDFKGALSDAGALEKGDGRGSDYNLLLPYEDYEDKAKYHISTGYRVYWDRLANVYDHAEAVAEVDGGRAYSSEYRKLANDLRDLGRMLDDPAFNKLSSQQQETRLDQVTSKLNMRVEDSMAHLSDMVQVNAAFAISSLWLQPKSADNPAGHATWHEMLDDNRVLQQSAARALWERPAATSGLGQGMDMDAVMARLVPQKSAMPEQQRKISMAAPETATP